MTNREFFIKNFNAPTYHDSKCHSTGCTGIPCISCAWWNQEYVEPLKKYKPKKPIKVFISQPMKGKTKEEIMQERKNIEDRLRGRQPAIFIDSYFGEGTSKNPLDSLGKSISLMGDADLVIMARGWQKARGCRIEYEVARAYDKLILDYSENPPRLVGAEV